MDYNNGQILRNIERCMIEHLQEQYDDDEDKQAEILIQEENLNVKYDPSEIPQAYFKSLQETQAILLFLDED